MRVSLAILLLASAAPAAAGQSEEGTLTVSTSLYRTRDRRITAEFVEGVLIRFIISSP